MIAHDNLSCKFKCVGLQEDLIGQIVALPIMYFNCLMHNIMLIHSVRGTQRFFQALQ